MQARSIAFLFPGQGAQEVGMGRDLIGRDPLCDELLAIGSEATGSDLARLARRGPPRKLAETKLLQPTLTAVSLALWRLLEEAGVRPDAVAGHSLGELPALAASGMTDPQGAVALAATRGAAMGAAAERQPGKMIAVTGATLDQVERAIEGSAVAGTVAPAAVNAPSQVTVSGDPEPVDALARTLASSEVRVTPLRVSGAWHSAHMRPAVEQFAAALERLTLAPARVPMVFNRHGGSETEPTVVRELLAGQLVSPIRWDAVMARLSADGVTDYVEIGPGKVLRGLTRLNLPEQDVAVHNVSDRRSLERVVGTLLS